MKLSRINALAIRIVRQFLRDHRSLALVFVVPIVIMSLLTWIMKAEDVHTDIAVTGNPQLVDFFIDITTENLANDDIRFTHLMDGNYEEGLKEGIYDAVIVFPDNLTRFLTSKENSTVHIYIEGSKAAKSDQLSDLLPSTLDGFLKSFSTGQINFDVAREVENEVAIETHYTYGGPQFDRTDHIAPVFMAFFAFFFVYLLTSVSFVRERAAGTIERLYVSPITKIEIVMGYLLGFFVFATVQSVIIMFFVIYGLGIDHHGNILFVFLIEFLLVLISVNLGIFLSSFAKNELQAAQFIPMVITPQVLLSGIFWPVDQLPSVLGKLAAIFPLTYANTALNSVMIKGLGLEGILSDLLIMAGFAVLFLILGALSMRRDLAYGS